MASGSVIFGLWVNFTTPSNSNSCSLVKEWQTAVKLGVRAAYVVKGKVLRRNRNSFGVPSVSYRREKESMKNTGPTKPSQNQHSSPRISVALLCWQAKLSLLGFLALKALLLPAFLQFYFGYKEFTSKIETGEWRSKKRGRELVGGTDGSFWSAAKFHKSTTAQIS